MDVECRHCKGEGKVHLEDINCFRCGNVIPRQPNIPENMDDGLNIKFSGGYGEFIDGWVLAKICKECAEAIQKTEPWIHYLLTQHLESDFGGW